MMNASYLPAFQSAVPAAVQQTVPAQAIAAFNNPQVLLSPEAQAQMSSQFAALGAQGQAIYASLLEAVSTASSGSSSSAVINVPFLAGPRRQRPRCTTYTRTGARVYPRYRSRRYAVKCAGSSGCPP